MTITKIIKAHNTCKHYYTKVGFGSCPCFNCKNFSNWEQK